MPPAPPRKLPLSPPSPPPAHAGLPANAASDNRQAVVSMDRRGTAREVPAELPVPPQELADSETAWRVPVLRLKMTRWIRFMNWKALAKSAKQKLNFVGLKTIKNHFVISKSGTLQAQLTAPLVSGLAASKTAALRLLF